MRLVDFIGFFISVVALVFLALRKVWENSQREKDPEAYRQREMARSRAMKQILRPNTADWESSWSDADKGLSHQKEKEEESDGKKILNIYHPPSKGSTTPQPPKAKKKEQVFDVPLNSPQIHLPYAVKLLDRLQSKQDLIIIQEILRAPKALYDYDSHR